MWKHLLVLVTALFLVGCNEQAAEHLPWETAKFKDDCEFNRGFSDEALHRAYDGRPMATPAPLGAVATFAVAIKPPITLEEAATCFESMAGPAE